MKLSSVSVLAVILVVGLSPTADSLFLSSSALLPISAIVSLGGVGGLKLAIAMKLLGMLGWRDVGRHGVGLRTSLERNMLPDRAIPIPGPRRAFSGTEISVPNALLPHIVTTGRYLKTVPVHLPPGKLFLLADRSSRFDSPQVRFSADGFASVRGTKGSTVHASGELKSPLVNVEAQKTATLRGRRNIENENIEEHPLVVKEAMQLVRDLDTDDCLLRLSCEVSADPPRYGSYGTRVAAFMNGTGPVENDSAFADFVKAYIWGKSSGVPGCAKEYPSCEYDLHALVNLVEVKS
ncbi:hypothetical protein HPB52_001146 [Rhipicephalus sanguineus]|uniref:Uncharacterized protein n=1 Tax=Rhipicephalus sanguineus TaxID=34632 RepID=A0A9D4Q9S0_RHISA|nr:hypothetical protein HPB52_001146 [Rhipicephalus sanguineus]